MSSSSNTPSGANHTPPPPPLYLEQQARAVHHQLTLAAAGKESTVITGDAGTGKSFALDVALQQLGSAGAAAGGTISGTPASTVFAYTTGAAAGAKTVLIDLLQTVSGRPLPANAKRSWTPLQCATQLIGMLTKRDIHVVCIDEAQHIDLKNLTHLKLVLNVAAGRGYSLGFILVGEPELATNIAAMNQLGQRFATLLSFRRLTDTEVTAYVRQLHPAVADAVDDRGVRDRRERWARYAKVSAGSIRRVVRIAETALELAAARQSPLTWAHVEAGLEKLAPGRGY